MKQWGCSSESTMTGKQYADVVGDLESRIPVGRIGTPQDVAQLVAFLVSDSAGIHHRSGLQSHRWARIDLE